MRLMQRLITTSVLLCSAIAAPLSPGAQETSAAPDQVEMSLTAPFIFGAAGDHGNGAAAIASLDGLAGSGASFYLALGDMSYDNVNPESQWCDLVKAHVGPVFPFELVSGNHEDNNLDGMADGLIENFASCLPDRMGNINGEYAREYYFDYPAVGPLARFILISPDLSFSDLQTYNYTIGSSHYNWLVSAIDGARADGITWVIVGMHKVCITVGNKSCEIGADLMNLLITKRVDLVLQGHDHNYQRSKQLTCAAAGSYNPACVADDGSDNLYTRGAGTVFVIGGMFGKGLYNIIPTDPEAGYFASWMGGNINPTNGFMKYTVSDAGITAQFVGTSGGTFTDNFSIVQSSVTFTPSPTTTPTPTLTPSSSPGPDSCSNPSAIMTISGNQSLPVPNSTYPTTSLSDFEKIDATSAVWSYLGAEPVKIGGGADICWYGGTIIGGYPADATWDTTHLTTGLAVKDSSARAIIEGVYIEAIGDAIQNRQGELTGQAGIIDPINIRGVYLHDIRDDCVESDWQASAIINDSLLDGCYVAFATRPRDGVTIDGSQNTWLITNSLVRLNEQIGVYGGPTPGHGMFFKWDKSIGDTGPKIELHNNVFRADSLNSFESNYGLGLPPNKVVSCSNNVMIWLGPDAYPAPLNDVNGNPCFTIMTGQAGLDYWNNAVANWKLQHGDIILPTPGPSPTPTMTPSQTPTPAVTVSTVTSQVISSADDAEENVSGGGMSLTSSDLELGADGTTPQYIGMRFNNITIPRNALIINAYVEFEVDELGSDPTSVLIQGQASDNALAFSSSTGNISGRARTTTQVAWNDIPAWTVTNAKWQTPNISSIVQEIVDRSGWVSGNSIVIIINGTGRRTAEAYDGEIPAAPKLVIQYATGDTPTPTVTASPTVTMTPSRTATPTDTGTPTITPTSTSTSIPTDTQISTNTPTRTNTPTPTATAGQSPTPTATAPVVTSQVISSADDAEEVVSGGSMSLTSSDLELGADAGVNQWVGMRFNNISIPRNATILNAYVEFEVDETGSDPTSVLIQGQAVDNALAFTTNNTNISSRARTTAQVAWNNIPAWTVLNAKWQTPNISSIIQEIVNRSGWASGNSIVILVSGSGRRTAEAYDGEIPAAPKLVIQYATGDTPTPTAITAPSLTSTPTAPADLIFANGFESGNLSAWSSNTTDGGDLSVSSSAALNGSYGLRAVIDDNNAIYVTDDSPNAESRYRARFYFDPNSILMGSSDDFYILYGYSGSSTAVMRIEFRSSSGAYQLRASLRNDSSSWTSSSWFTMSDAPHFIEVDWRASTASGTNNGGLTLWIDGTQRAALNGVDNDTRRIDHVQLGAVSGINSGTRGTCYFDQFESRRQTYIGP